MRSQPNSRPLIRDLVGYGQQAPSIVWPNGARVAVSIVVNFEEGAEWQVGDGDPQSERVGEVISVVKPGDRDQGQEQIFGYGMRVGFWRFIRALSRSSIRATFLCCGRAVERAPENALAIVRHGHEVACHGWRWRPHSDYDCADAEFQDLQRCVDVTQAATGTRPLGFFCRGSESPWTRQILNEMGFQYSSNAFDDDLPYYDESSGLTIVPYNLDANDMKFFHPNGFVHAQEMVEYVDAALTQLLTEAENGHSSTLTIGYHLRITGRPARFRAFSAVLDRLSELENRVWCAPRLEIARHFQSQVPLPS